MRVISGEKRGFKLQGPNGNHSRPTEDKIKEAIFNILFPLIPDAICLDVFSCTGSIGIEFLSRGAKKVYFSELNYDNIKILKENLIKTDYLERSEILRGDFRKNLSLINEQIDYIYLDPPYKKGFYTIAFEEIMKKEEFKNSQIIVESDQDIDYSKEFHDLKRRFHRSYGRKYISIYERLK